MRRRQVLGEGSQAQGQALRQGALGRGALGCVALVRGASGRAALLVAGTLLLAACAAPSEPPSVLMAQVRLGPAEGGLVRVEGLPGAVLVSEATTLTVTMVRETPAPAAYALQHLSGGLPIASTYAEVRADGSFGPVQVGSAERPVQRGDELNLTPQAGVRQVGFTVYGLQVP